MEWIQSLLDVAPLHWAGIFTAIICGGLIGLERQIFGKPAGIRTSALICLACYVFVCLSQLFTGGSADATRILGQIVTGIGFLGAGVIISKEGVVQGMTSAATIWMLAAIGSVIGLGFYKVALVLDIVVLGVLLGIDYFERLFSKVLQRGVHKHFLKQRRYTKEH